MLAKTFLGTAMVVSAAFLASASQAASPSSSSMKLSQAECDTLWNQANPSKGPTITMSQAQPFVSDFKSVDTDNDGTIDLTEFNKGCTNGFVKSSGSSGSSSGSSGSSGSSSSGSSK